MSKNTLSKEEEILHVMKKVLTDIAKDTYTPANLKHPLSEGTIVSIRECLTLITSREAELAQEAGRESNMRPRYVDEPSSSVVVNLDPTNFKPKKD
ncbi:MAG: segregation and condensation protein A [Gammaproteobacteria bacterium]|nr:segregation and condensation protein A [Gammaproteobacteria bacterium]MCW8987415.1 segregation and condensation protein A [Gammaproteobacteria bacterium]MCW9031585.1 segregation and condensation protein A [Gammaproteobacteria bacterium]